ncbi:tetratricopeptide repeat protein [Silanimonas sp.]|jgi:tetratricopeptide (TPR) repeat protein|uniref:tetratricopeptide repeat protein n=1 Tax=Silanimonas sp. TaxID=1929290 RepID=UPI0037C6AED0
MLRMPIKSEHARARALTPNEAASMQTIIRALAEGRQADALAMATRLLEGAPDAADAWHVAAICFAEEGRHAEADDAFREALRLAPAHPMIVLNQARWLGRIGRHGEALGSWQALARRAGASGEDWLGLARCCLALSRYREATEAFESASKAGADPIRVASGMASALQGLGDLGAAESVLRGCADQARNAPEIQLALANIERLQGRPESAIERIESLRLQGVDRPEVEDAYVGVLIDAMRIEEARHRADALVRAHPSFVAGHLTRAHLRWEHPEEGDDADPCIDLRESLSRSPDDLRMALSFAGFLLRAKRPDEALPILEFVRRREDSPLVQAMMANAYELLGQPERAQALFDAADRSLGDIDPEFNNAFVRHLLKAGRIDEAAARGQRNLRLDPLRQETWAYLATAWRLLGDEREAWLCDYERLAALIEVETPRGWSTRNDFLRDLEAALLPYHRARREPAAQSVRGGSQTPGRLFGRKDSPIVALRDALVPAMHAWLAQLPEDPGHPFLGRPRTGFRFAGSWSVRLWRSGSHANHFHGEGWMSSAFYVALPPSTLAHDGDAGCIQFGQPPVELGLGLPPRRVVHPIPGHVALFPSYLWHGTVPFEDDSPRMTVAFDVSTRV